MVSATCSSRSATPGLLLKLCGRKSRSPWSRDEYRAMLASLHCASIGTSSTRLPSSRRTSSIVITSAYLSLASWRWSTKTYSSGRGDQKVTGAPGLALETAHCFGPLLPGTSNPKASLWATRGVEFSAKLRTWARKIEELEADIKELKAIPERI